MTSENKAVGQVKTTGYKVTIGILVAIIAVLLWMLLYTKEEVKAVESKSAEVELDLQGQLDSLMAEHELIKGEYGELTEQAFSKDSVILANAEEIKRLIAKSADYRQIKRKLDQLRNIQQSHVDQLDSLYTVNRLLNEELVVAKDKITEKTQQTEILSQEKEQLTKIVETGAVLKAYNVSGTTFSLKGKTERETETFKARRVDRVKIRFTISENNLSKPGPRTAYVRIARPDGLIISKGKGDQYSFDANGTRLQYSLKYDFDYKNEAINVELNWDKQTDTPAMEGKYHVGIYLDGQMIGQNYFVLD